MTALSTRKLPKKQRQLHALRHGLTAHVVLMPGEDMRQFQAHCRQYHEEFQPVTRKEKKLTQTLAEFRWRLNRVIAAEINMAARNGIDNAPKVSSSDEPVAYALATAAFLRDHSTDLMNISLYEQRLVRQYEVTRHQLLMAKWQREYDARERKRKERAILAA